MLVGGIARNFGEHGSSYRLGQGRDFVIEGDEYDSAFFDKTAKFLKYLPDIAVINNVEFDHADIYADFDAVTLAFRRLVNLVPRRGLLLLGADSARRAALAARRVSRVADASARPTDADWQAHDLEPAGASTRFRVRRGGSPFGTFEVPLVGAHNVRNALAAIAVATEVGIGAGAHRATACAPFAGVKRRLEVVGVAGGVTVYDDFAHHPTAVAETLAGLRAVESRRRASGRCSSRDPPRRAAASSRTTSPARSAAADEVLHRAGLPLDAARGGAAVGAAAGSRSATARGQSAREAESIDDIVATIVSRAPPRRSRRADVERRLRRHSPEAAAGARA